MGEMETLRFSIPSDEDGFITLQCAFCGELFKVSANSFEDDSILDIYCPACGLISDNYFTEEVMLLAESVVYNYAVDLINDSFKQLNHKNKNGPIHFDVKRGKKKEEKPIRTRIDILKEKSFSCCQRSAKVSPLLLYSVVYCPYCGVISFADR